MYKNAAAIGADIGRDNIRVATVKINGKIVSGGTYHLSGKKTRDKIIQSLISAVKVERQRAAESGINTISIGVAARGFVDHPAGIIIGPGHGIAGWKDIPLARIISRETGLPAFVGNDANLMTIAEQRFGTAKGYRNVIFIALRTGIGGGIIINGSLYRGVNNAGGEIGQMIINYTAGKSDTGIAGSYEYFASGAALSRRFAQISNSGNREFNQREIIDFASKGDSSAIEALKENAFMVGIGVANLITIFAPEMIVIGGNMAAAGKSYLSAIRKSAFRNSLSNCRSEVKIEPAALGQNASLIGAAYYSLVKLAGKQI